MEREARLASSRGPSAPLLSMGDAFKIDFVAPVEEAFAFLVILGMMLLIWISPTNGQDSNK